MSTKIPLNQGQALRLDESSDPSVSLARHKACQCATRMHTHSVQRLKRSFSICNTDRIMVSEKNHELVWWERKKGDADQTAQATTHTWTFKCSAMPGLPGHLWLLQSSDRKAPWLAITTGFLFIRPLCNPSGFAEQPFGATLNTQCSKGSHKHSRLLSGGVLFQTGHPEGHEPFPRHSSWRMRLTRRSFGEKRWMIHIYLWISVVSCDFKRQANKVQQRKC